MNTYHRIEPQDLTNNPFSLIGQQWMLITAGDKHACNTMTASWGGVGVLWNRPVAFAFVRPQRYTYTFLETHDTFSLSFLPESHREALQYCGSHSGRNENKLAAAGLSVVWQTGTPCIEQAELVLICRKLHAVDFSPEQFCDSTLLSHYKANDYHRQYIGEILEARQR